jgi:sigma-B regulation protein RsbU (phosphoserine phosphatase)
MVYALYNFRDGTLHFARAGHPYPLHVPAEGEPEFWQVQGSLLGVFDTSFPVQTRRVQPGDKVLFYSDGIDSAVLEGSAPGNDSLLACAGRHRALPVQEFIAALAQDMFSKDAQIDDLTLLGLEITT